MVVYDESGHRIEEYDLDKGYLENKSEAVEHRWVVDSEEQGEWVTLKEYPETGGKDVEWRVTAEEQGHWRTTDAEGEEVADFGGTLSDDWPHDVSVPDVFEYAIYHPYTEEELEEREKQRQEAEAEAERKRAIDEGCQAFFIDGGKSQMEQAIEDAAASGGETNPQIMTFAALALAPMASTLTDEQIMSVSSLWPEWSQDSVAYKVDDVVQYSNKLWRCEQAHTSQVSWAPDTAPSLWSQIDIADDGIDVWTQPTGAHNAYNKGDRVHYPSKDSPIYESLIDGNSWSPDAYPAGWQVVTDADTE